MANSVIAGSTKISQELDEDLNNFNHNSNIEKL
jgi:hypothetical protein